MKAFLIFLIFISAHSFAQKKKQTRIPDANFEVISSEAAKDYPDGVFLLVRCQLKESINGDHTTIFSLVDDEIKMVLSSGSQEDGVIQLNLFRLMDIRYLIIGGLNDSLRKIDLTKLKGRKMEIALVVEPNRAQMY